MVIYMTSTTTQKAEIVMTYTPANIISTTEDKTIDGDIILIETGETRWVSLYTKVTDVWVTNKSRNSQREYMAIHSVPMPEVI